MTKYDTIIKHHVTPIRGKANFYKVHKPFEVYKRVVYCCGDRTATIKLVIPKEAIVRLMAHDKCRASKAIPIIPSGRSYESIYSPSFTYKDLIMVEPRVKFSVSDTECASGIHFFITRDEARRYI